MSEKNRDAKNRRRTVTVAFRLSPEENEELTNRVKCAGAGRDKSILYKAFCIRRLWLQAIR